VAAIIDAERRKAGAADVVRALEQAGFDLDGTPYPQFIERYFSARA
jgi:hypothetical protein